MKNKPFLSSLWVLFVSRRFSRVDRKGRSAVTSFLASLGICFGVMTLITVISVMNGFQLSFIDAIMEISSYHVRVDNVEPAAFEAFCQDEPSITAATTFYEAQSLLVGENERQSAALIRGVSENQLALDEGFRNQLHMVRGHFDLSGENSIVIGSGLASQLGIFVGTKVNLFALSGGNDVDLVSSDRIFTVKGVFHTGYADLNAAYAFISLKNAEKYFGESAVMHYGLKLQNSADDALTVSRIREHFPQANVESWKDYNRSFFGALRVEKNMLMLLVFLIFIVVGINIFNGMRRMVYERREEISVLSAFGGKASLIQAIFVTQGFLVGVIGAIPGLAIGLLLSVRMTQVFSLMSKIVYYVQYFGYMIISPESALYLRENPMYMVYANIPPRIIPSEVLVITIFGIFSSLLASWVASRGVLKMTVAEVLRDE
ncbi:MAG: ABC transporter permease [Treponema sp.]|nr:ABC transporter permease [Treponema sp.]